MSTNASFLITFLLRLIVTIPWYNNCCVVQSWSFSSSDNNNSNSNNSNNLSRRQIIKKSCTGITLLTTSFAVMAPSDKANAACLQGDLRTECIGVYKVPIDDGIKSYISTPEALQKWAPDLKFVDPIEYSSPKSYQEAIDILKQQQYIANNDIKQLLLEGKLELAGKKVLYALPKITISGRYILDELESRIRNSSAAASTESSAAASSTESSSSTSTTSVIDELKIERIENQYNLMNGYWGEIDIEIGQGIRGDLGVSAVAQITVLSTLRDVTSSIDDFLITAQIKE